MFGDQLIMNDPSEVSGIVMSLFPFPGTLAPFSRMAALRQDDLGIPQPVQEGPKGELREVLPSVRLDQVDAPPHAVRIHDHVGESRAARALDDRQNGGGEGGRRGHGSRTSRSRSSRRACPAAYFWRSALAFGSGVSGQPP